jgi:hypothetical protein
MGQIALFMPMTLIYWTETNVTKGTTRAVLDASKEFQKSKQFQYRVILILSIQNIPVSIIRYILDVWGSY